MNRTILFVVFAILAMFSIAGIVVLAILKPDSVSNYVSFIFQMLALVTVAAGTFYGLGKTDQKVEVVKRQTNGTLSTLLDRLAEKDERIAELERATTNE